MNADLMLVSGVVAIVVSAFPLLNGFSRGEMPRAWAVMCIGGFGLVATVMGGNPNTYNVATIPDVFARVLNASL